MTETERNQIKGALLKCAEENENKFTLTGHIVVSSLCKSAIERIEELEKENAELKANNQFLNSLVREKEQRGLEIQEDLLRENEKLKEQCLILAEGRRIVGYGRSKPILKGV